MELFNVKFFPFLEILKLLLQTNFHLCCVFAVFNQHVFEMSNYVFSGEIGHRYVLDSACSLMMLGEISS